MPVMPAATSTTSSTTAFTTKPLARRRTPPARDPQAGDLIFVRPSADDWAGQLITRATDGFYCHCRVRLSRDEVVEALDWRGIVRAAVGVEPDANDVAHIGLKLERARFIKARGWLLDQVGDGYSEWDIAADAVKALLPHALGSRTPFLVAPAKMDCSELAARWLIHAGYEWLPDELMDDPARCSPNDLARALGVLK